MPFQTFIDRAIAELSSDHRMLALAAGGSWIDGRLDAYSDLDLVLVSHLPVAPRREAMEAVASRLGPLLTSFTGEHVGEPRLLICLYDPPLLHVDLKFVTPPELAQRVEDPALLWERSPGLLQSWLAEGQARWPQPDPQWLEDRFWVWIHYVGLKLERGEYLECIEGLGFLRARVLGPLHHLLAGKPDRSLRRLEQWLPPPALAGLHATLATPHRPTIVAALHATVAAYTQLRTALSWPGLTLRSAAETRVKKYLETL